MGRNLREIIARSWGESESSKRSSAALNASSVAIAALIEARYAADHEDTKMRATHKRPQTTLIDIVLGFIALVSLYIGIKNMLGN